jgi:LemA protein
MIQPPGNTPRAQKPVCAPENYPDLKADDNFIQLQKRIAELQERIADRREYFIDDVNTYNVRIQQLPDVFIARMLGLRSCDLFKAEAYERADVQIRLT